MFAGKVKLAKAIVANLPVATVNLLQSRDWKGGPLQCLPESKGIRTPSAKEISANYFFLLPVVRFMPRKVGCRGNERQHTHIYIYICIYLFYLSIYLSTIYLPITI